MADQKIQIVTKDSRRHEPGKKSHKVYIKRLKKDILRNNQLSSSSFTGSSTPSTVSSAASTF